MRFDCLTSEQVQELVKYQPLRGLWVNHLPKPFGEEALLEALSVIKRPVQVRRRMCWPVAGSSASRFSTTSPCLSRYIRKG